MPMNTGRTPNLVTEPALKHVFQIGYRNASKESIYDKIWRVEDARYLQEKMQTLDSFPLFAEGSEGGIIPAATFDELYKTTIKYSKWNLGFVVSLELQEFEHYGIVKGMTQELSLAAYQTVEWHSHRWFNNCTDSTDYPLQNGQSWLSTTHPLKNGSVFANKPATDVDIDTSTIEDAVYYYRTIPNDSGNKVQGKKPGILFADVKDEPRVLKILDARFQPFEESNTPNIISTRWNLKPIFTTWFTDTNNDMWFMLPAEVAYNFFLWFRRPEVRVGYQDNTWNKLVNCVFMCNEKPIDPRDIYGSTGE